MLKQSDCPLNNPDGHKEGSDLHHVPYISPCEHWADGVCLWFDTPRPVKELLDFRNHTEATDSG